MNEKVENCPKCRRAKSNTKFYPYCSIEHWKEMVEKG